MTEGKKYFATLEAKNFSYWLQGIEISISTYQE